MDGFRKQLFCNELITGYGHSRTTIFCHITLNQQLFPSYAVGARQVRRHIRSEADTGSQEEREFEKFGHRRGAQTKGHTAFGAG